MRNEQRILALAPYSDGLGYAVVEWPVSLVSGGVKAVSNRQRGLLLANVAELMTRYRPSVIVLEDPGQATTHRAGLLKSLQYQIQRDAALRRVPVRICTRKEIKIALGLEAQATKHDVALGVAARLAELMPKVPPRRRFWMDANYYMPLFEAAALAITYMNR